MAEVKEQASPQLPDEPVDPGEFRPGALPPATQVTTDDSALEAALDEQFSPSGHSCIPPSGGGW